MPMRVWKRINHSLPLLGNWESHKLRVHARKIPRAARWCVRAKNSALPVQDKRQKKTAPIYLDGVCLGYPNATTVLLLWTSSVQRAALRGRKFCVHGPRPSRPKTGLHVRKHRTVLLRLQPRKRHKNQEGIYMPRGKYTRPSTQVGRQYGRLTVLEEIPYTDEEVRTLSSDKRWKRKRAVCRCTCGTIKEYRLRNLSEGDTRSCGCLSIELALANLKSIQSVRPQQSPEIAGARHAFICARNNAKKRGIPFQLTQDEVTAYGTQPCHYCGTIKSNRIILSNGEFWYNGIDRQDNTRGYTLKNCVPCCKLCNHFKGKRTVNEFLSWAERAYQHQPP